MQELNSNENQGRYKGAEKEDESTSNGNKCELRLELPGQGVNMGWEEGTGWRLVSVITDFGF